MNVIFNYAANVAFNQKGTNERKQNLKLKTYENLPCKSVCVQYTFISFISSILQNINVFHCQWDHKPILV